MLQFRVTLRDMALTRKFRKGLKLFDDLTPEMRQVGAFLIEDAGRRLAARGSKVSIGRLLKSLRAQAFKRSVTVSSVLPYARMQQEGGTIRPKKRKYLAIPLQTDLARKHVWPKHYTGKRLTLVRIGDILWEKNVKTKGLVRAAFVLKQQVVIPPRPYLVKSAALIRFMKTAIAKRLDRFKREKVG